MNRKKETTWAFIFGYFVALSPSYYALNGDLVDGLVWGIIGLVTSLLIFCFTKNNKKLLKKLGECEKDGTKTTH